MAPNFRKIDQEECHNAHHHLEPKNNETHDIILTRTISILTYSNFKLMLRSFSIFAILYVC